jgi:hypothetical protein
VEGDTVTIVELGFGVGVEVPGEAGLVEEQPQHIRNNTARTNSFVNVQ